MINDCFPRISVKMSSRDPPFLSPLVKYLCNIRNRRRSHRAESMIRQEKINAPIRTNQVNAVKNERAKHSKRSKGWWETVNRVTGRKSQGARMSSVIYPGVINSFFQSINTDDTYEAPEPLSMSPGTRVPTVEKYDMFKLLIHQKRTAKVPNEIPYWFWCVMPTISLQWSPPILIVRLDSILFHLCGN